MGKFVSTFDGFSGFGSGFSQIWIDLTNDGKNVSTFAGSSRFGNGYFQI